MASITVGPVEVVAMGEQVKHTELEGELLAALKVAAIDVCSMLCPSVWKTGERPPHSDKCRQIQAAIAKAEAR